MKKVAVLLMVLLSMVVFASSASAKARGIIIWGPKITGVPGYGHVAQ